MKLNKLKQILIFLLITSAVLFSLLSCDESANATGLGQGIIRITNYDSTVYWWLYMRVTGTSTFYEVPFSGTIGYLDQLNITIDAGTYDIRLYEYNDYDYVYWNSITVSAGQTRDLYIDLYAAPELSGKETPSELGDYPDFDVSVSVE